jgi:Mrp family chromosome partitioning ATPase
MWNVPEERSLGAFLRTVRDGWPLVVAAVVACTVLALLATLLQPERHRASGEVVVSPAAFLDPDGTDALPALTDTIVQLSSSPAVLGPTASGYIAAAPDGRKLAERTETATPAWVRANTRARRVGTSSVVELSATGADERDAVDLTRSFVSSLSEFVQSARREGAQPDSSDAGGARLVVLGEGDHDGQISPTPARNVLVGINAGLILGVLLAFALGDRRRRRGPSEAAEALGVPSLGVLEPGVEAGGTGMHATEQLLTAVSGPGGDLVVVLTGSASSEHIAEAAETLARSLARRGYRTLIIDGDRETQALARRLGADQQRGLSAVLDGLAAAVEAEVLVVGEEPAGADGDAPVHVLPMGGAPAAAVADADALRRAVDELLLHYDVVVISGPPLGRDDALPVLISVADCWLLLADGDVTPRRLADARALMEQSGTPVMGMLGIDRGSGSSRRAATA